MAGEHLPLTKSMQRAVRDDPTAERLVARAALLANGCWAWTGSVNEKGYGYIRFRDKTWKAHRVSYTVFCQEIPSGLQVCHHCDTPNCINPSHLFPSTLISNMRDMIRKGRGKGQISSLQNHFRASHAPRGANGSGAKLTEEQMREIVSKHQSGAKTKALAEQYGVNRTTIQRIMRGETWRTAGRAALPPSEDPTHG